MQPWKQQLERPVHEWLCELESLQTFTAIDVSMAAN